MTIEVVLINVSLIQMSSNHNDLSGGWFYAMLLSSHTPQINGSDITPEPAISRHEALSGLRKPDFYS